jgi:hypothetical protein
MALPLQQRIEAALLTQVAAQGFGEKGGKPRLSPTRPALGFLTVSASSTELIV